MPSTVKISELPTYYDAWKDLQAGLPELDPHQITDVLGHKVVLNVPGGGCKTIASGSRAHGLRLLGIPVTDIYGTSAGCSMGAMYLEGSMPDEAAIYFVERVNLIERNFNFRHLASGQPMCPHEPILTETMRRSGICTDLLRKNPTNIHIVQTSTDEESYLGAWLRVLGVFSFYNFVSHKKKTPLLNQLCERLFDSTGQGVHLPLSQLLDIQTQVLDSAALIEENNVIEAFMRSACTPPVTRIRRRQIQGRRHRSYFDGSVTYTNLLPLIAHSNINPSTVITLLPGPRSHYNDAYLGLSGYNTHIPLHPDLLLARDPTDEALPPQHLIWSLPAQPISTWDYTDPQTTLDLFTYGYRSLYHLVEALDLKQTHRKAS